MTDITLTADADAFGRGLPVYHPRRGKNALFAAFFLLLALFTLPTQGHAIARWIAGGALPSGQSWSLLISGLVCLGFGLMILVGVLRGRPRLTVTPTGLQFDEIFGTQWADWNSLSAFELTTTAVTRRRTVRHASAAIVGSAASAKLLRRGRLTLPDSFQVPLDGIIANLAVRQSLALGAAPPPPPVSEAAASAPVGLAPNAPLWLSVSLIGLLVAVFAAEQVFAIAPGQAWLEPSLATLVALGGLNWTTVVAAGEWYRLLTAPLLHLNLAHLGANIIAFLMAAAHLERLIGRAWFLACFMLGGLGGALASLALNPATTVSVGASGAIMALFAVTLVCSLRLPSGNPQRLRMQSVAIRVLLLSLLPLATTREHIDYGAHLGGAVSGALLGLLLLKTWPEGAALPRLRKLALSVGAAGVIAAAAGGGAVAYRYPAYAADYAALAALIPQNVMPKTLADMEAQGPRLMQRYPGDPRGYLFSAMALVSSHDYANAELTLRLALAQSAGLKLLGAPAENMIRAQLAVVLLEEHQRDAAKEQARLPCRSDDPNLRQALVNEQLCDNSAPGP